jgi:hypothetical protein
MFSSMLNDSIHIAIVAICVNILVTVSRSIFDWRIQLRREAFDGAAVFDIFYNKIKPKTIKLIISSEGAGTVKHMHVQVHDAHGTISELIRIPKAKGSKVIIKMISSNREIVEPVQVDLDWIHLKNGFQNERDRTIIARPSRRKILRLF